MKIKQLTEHSNLFSRFREYFLVNDLSLLIVEDTEEGLIVHESSKNKIICNQSGHSYPFDHFLLNSLSSPPKNKRITRNGKVPYLLSGCVAILSYEPCIMCAMALLHSRIDAVVYFERNEMAGALGSNCFLHSMDSLNHHFPVYIVKDK